MHGWTNAFPCVGVCLGVCRHGCTRCCSLSPFSRSSRRRVSCCVHGHVHRHAHRRVYAPAAHLIPRAVATTVCIDMYVDMCLGLCIDICIVGPGSDVGSGVAKNAVAMFSSVANYAVARSRVGIFWRAERLLGARIGKELKCDVALQHMNSQPRIAQLCPKHKTPNKTRPSLLTTRFWPIKSFD